MFNRSVAFILLSTLSLPLKAEPFSIYPNPFQYIHSYEDHESTLQYFNTRYYQPATMHFIEQDKFLGKKSLFDHTYNYAASNPISNSDPSGQYSAHDFINDVAPWSPVEGLILAANNKDQGKIAANVFITLAGIGLTGLLSYKTYRYFRPIEETIDDSVLEKSAAQVIQDKPNTQLPYLGKPRDMGEDSYDIYSEGENRFIDPNKNVISLPTGYYLIDSDRQVINVVTVHLPSNPQCGLTEQIEQAPLAEDKITNLRANSYVGLIEYGTTLFTYYKRFSRSRMLDFIESSRPLTYLYQVLRV